MRAILTAVVLCVVGMVAGCTMTETAQQRNQRIAQQAELQMHMLVEDIDAVLLLDRSSSLSKWNSNISQ